VKLKLEEIAKTRELSEIERERHWQSHLMGRRAILGVCLLDFIIFLFCWIRSVREADLLALSCLIFFFYFILSFKVLRRRTEKSLIGTDLTYKDVIIWARTKPRRQVNKRERILGCSALVLLGVLIKFFAPPFLKDSKTIFRGFYAVWPFFLYGGLLGLFLNLIVYRKTGPRNNI
jgi:hypothetical protein